MKTLIINTIRLIRLDGLIRLITIQKSLTVNLLISILIHSFILNQTFCQILGNLTIIVKEPLKAEESGRVTGGSEKLCLHLISSNLEPFGCCTNKGCCSQSTRCKAMTLSPTLVQQMEKLAAIRLEMLGE